MFLQNFIHVTPFKKKNRCNLLLGKNCFHSNFVFENYLTKHTESFIELENVIITR